MLYGNVALPEVAYLRIHVGTWIVVSFPAIFSLNRDYPVVNGEGSQSTQRKPPPNPKLLATFSYARAGIRTQAVVRDNEQSVAHH